MFENVELSSSSATIIFVIGCLAGYQYRRIWKNEGSRAQLWLFGLIAAAALLTVGLIPLAL